MKEVDGPSVRESREEKRLEDRLVWIVLLFGLPFIYLAVDRASLTTLILFQAYALTATVGCIVGIRRRAVLRQKWFLKAIICSLPVHITALVGIFYWDKMNVGVAYKGFYTIGVVWVASVAESVLVLVLVDFWERRETKTEPSR